MIWAWLAIQAIMIGIFLWKTGRLKKQKVATPGRIYGGRQQRDESKEMRELRLMRAKSLMCLFPKGRGLPSWKISWDSRTELWRFGRPCAVPTPST